MNRHPRAMLTTLGLLLGLTTGCETIDGYQLIQLTDPPFPASTDGDTLQVTEGTAVAVRIVLLDGTNLVDPREDVLITPESDLITFDTIPDAPGFYIVGGNQVGSTTLLAELDTLAGGCIHIPVDVTVQPPVPDG